MQNKYLLYKLIGYVTYPIRPILLERIGVSLQNLLNLVTLCICLHNFYIIAINEFNIRWTKEAKKDFRTLTNQDFSNLLHVEYEATL